MAILKNDPTWKCDTCGKERRQGEAKKEGWVHFSTEDRMVDRMFHEHVMCSYCIKQLDAARNRA